MIRNWKIHHVAHAVRSLDEAISYYEKSFGWQVIARESVPTQLVEVAFLKSEGTLLELISPMDGNTTIQPFLLKRGEGLHHLAFEVEDLRESLEALASDGFRLIDTEPRPGSLGMQIAFVHPKSTHGVLIEICQLPCLPS